MVKWQHVTLCCSCFSRVMKIIGLKVVGRNHYDPESAIILGKHRLVLSCIIRRLTAASTMATLVFSLPCLCVFIGCRCGQAIQPPLNPQTEACIYVSISHTKSWGMTLCWMSCEFPERVNNTLQADTFISISQAFRFSDYFVLTLTLFLKA